MLVSRNTKTLSKEQLYSAAIESLAENFVDGVVSPLFYYLLFGLPGIIIQRCVNTMDAMIGYRNEKYEKFGKVAARFDDVLNFIPARISVLLFMPFNPKGVITASKTFGGIKINGTYSISAMAGVLNIRLWKQNVYDILPCRPLPTQNHLKKSLKIYAYVAFETILIVLLSMFLIYQLLNIPIFSTFEFSGLVKFIINSI